MKKEIKAVAEPSCGGLWCISIRGWYYRENNANRTFPTKKEAEKFIKDNQKQLMALF